MQIDLNFSKRPQIPNLNHVSYVAVDGDDARLWWELGGIDFSNAHLALLSNVPGCPGQLARFLLSPTKAASPTLHVRHLLILRSRCDTDARGA